MSAIGFETKAEHEALIGNGALATRCTALGTEDALVVHERASRLARSGRKILHLEIGEPGFATRAPVVEAGVRGIVAGMTGYAPPAGIPALRETIAASLTARGVEAASDRVVVSTGAKAMLYYVSQCLVERGTEALIPDPGFPIYGSLVRKAGAAPSAYPLQSESGYRPDVDALIEGITDRTRVVFLNSPHNPTGGVATADDLERIAAAVIKHDLIVISDEVYGELRFDNSHTSIASLPGMAQRTVLVDSFSKAYAMTGWRLGYGLLPAWLVEPVKRLVINTVSCVPPFVQLAGAAALSDTGVCFRSLTDDLKARRDLMVSGLNSIDGISCPTPSAAFYVFPDVRVLQESSGLSSRELATRILDEEGVALLPGTSFGSAGEGHLRLTFSVALETIERALERINRFVNRISKEGVG